jgi:hypothetical protein
LKVPAIHSHNFSKSERICIVNKYTRWKKLEETMEEKIGKNEMWGDPHCPDLVGLVGRGIGHQALIPRQGLELVHL